MHIDKTLQPGFIDGYTYGFCDGLAGRVNAHEMPEVKWNSEKILDLEAKSQDALFVSDVERNVEEYQKEYKHIGYNWGFNHGLIQRNKMKEEIPADIFERHLELLAETMKIQFLRVGRTDEYHYTKALDVNENNRLHVEFVNWFIIDQTKEKLKVIRSLLEEKKTQRAIDYAVAHFYSLKLIDNYFTAVSLEVRLKDIRGYSLEKEEYREQKLQIEKDLADLIGS